MSESAKKALLPAGLEDLLPPQAAAEARVVESLIAAFSAQGYERIKPPLMEFEEGLLTGAGAAVAQQTFRLMDPVSQRMMGLRADMTPQVARIAASRLAGAPRPLRLCYGGQVLRVRGSQLRSERQFGQVGVELIGAEAGVADSEVIVLAIEALSAAGVEDLSVDLSLPPLVSQLTEALGFAEPEAVALRQALDGKDEAEVKAHAGAQEALFLGLLRSVGPARAGLDALAALNLPQALQDEVQRLAQVIGLIETAVPGVALTVDVAEHRGFEYQTGISFIFFAKGVRGELGRGGRYCAARVEGADEPSTGFTLYMDSVLRALPQAETSKRLYLPWTASLDQARALRAEGWVTVVALGPDEDEAAEARRLNCTYLWTQDGLKEL